MSLLEQLIKSKRGLKPTETIVTQQDGRRFLINSGEYKEVSCKRFGFVVDNKPDNIPAEIIEHLYLGSQDCCDLTVLQNYSIAYVLSIGVEPPHQYQNIVYKFVQCLDLPETNILSVLRIDCLEFVKSAIDRNESVLLHCNAGVSRSPSIVIGFLMSTYKLSYEEAFISVKSKRSCIKPNSGFETQLKCLFLSDI